MNLRLAPEDTYFFDAYTLAEAEDMLDDVTFYTELGHNIVLKNFLKER